MDNDDAAAATIAAVAAAAAASHQAQEQQHLQEREISPAQQDGDRNRQPDNQDTDRQLHESGQDGDLNANNEAVTSEEIRRRTEEAAQQAVVAAAAAHRAHQERQQQQQQRQGEQTATAAPLPPPPRNEQSDEPAQQEPQATQERNQGSSEAGPSTSKSSRTRSAPSPNGGQPKRRKINTCLQCKARKVKCDKARPLCGPCRKHGIAEACTWADEDSGNAWPASEFGQNGQAQATWPAQQSPFAGPFNSGGATGLVGDPQAMVERIVQLEAQVAQQRAQGGDQNNFYDSNNGSYSGSNNANLDPFLGGSGSDRPASAEDAATSASQQLAAWSTQFANVSEAERGMAADALAMIAQHHPQNNRGLGPLTSGTSSLLSGIRFPFSIRATPEALREAINLLPSDENIDFLLNHVLTPLFMTSWVHCASPRLVSIQLTRFQEQRDAENIASVDVSFLALLFNLLVLATDFADVAQILSRNIVEKEESIPGLIELWLSTGEALLSMADFMGSPSLNCLMALTAARHFYSSQGRSVQQATTISLSISLAQALGLHRLGSARDDEARWSAEGVKPDPDAGNILTARESIANEFGSRDETSVRDALTSGGAEGGIAKHCTDWHLPDRSHLVRETGRKMWYYLVCRDWIATAQAQHTYRIVPGQWNTALPLNLDDAELPDGTGDNPYQLPPEKPPGHPADAMATPHFYAITKVCAEICDAHSWGKKPTYEEILSFDAKWRKIVDELPVYLRLDGESEHLDYVRDQEHHRPYLSSVRFGLLETINHRLVMLHRGFLIRGHYDSRYEPSVKASVDAARMIIFCRQSVVQSGDPLQKFWHFRHHAFNAAMLLAMHLLELAKRGIRNTEETTRLREEIAVALTMIDDNKRTNAFPTGDGNAPSTARHIISRLVQEADVRVQGGAQDGSRENNFSESLEGLYTHAADTSEDHHAGDQVAGQDGVGSAAFPHNDTLAGSENEADHLNAELNQLLNTLLARSDSVPGRDHPSVSDTSEIGDPDNLWRMIDSYARPSFV
ncbi:unnamed protein product [Sympodiomycopsis kandeliae]